MDMPLNKVNFDSNQQQRNKNMCIFVATFIFARGRTISFI